MDLFSLGEVTRLTGLARRTLFRMRERNEFPQALRIGRAVLWRADDLNTWLRQHMPDSKLF